MRIHRPSIGLFWVIALLWPRLTIDAQLPAYRNRLLGVFNSQTGEPIEGAEVIDALEKNKALTTKTGTVTLAFLPDGGSLVRVQRIGYELKQMFVAISPSDTVPLTVLLDPIATKLPAMVTRDSTTRRYISPGLQAFEERRRTSVGGHFIAEAQLRKSDDRTMTNVIRSIPGIRMDCARTDRPASSGNPGGHRRGECWASAMRVNSKYAILGGGCEVEVYVDGVPATDNDLEKFQVKEYAAIEFYAGGASMPTQYNRTGSSCGVLLFWSRER